jgi:hypothetical protein
MDCGRCGFLPASGTGLRAAPHRRATQSSRRSASVPQGQRVTTITATQLAVLSQEIISGRKCTRLVRYRERVARTKRRAFRECTYWGRPVPGFGDPRADAPRPVASTHLRALHGNSRPPLRPSSLPSPYAGGFPSPTESAGWGLDVLPAIVLNFACALIPKSCGGPRP